MDTSSVSSSDSSGKERDYNLIKNNELTSMSSRSNFTQQRSATTKTSKYRGVSFLKGKGLWRARIEYDGKRMHLGCFKNEDDAARKYDEKSFILHGHKGIFNFPEEIKKKND